MEESNHNSSSLVDTSKNLSVEPSHQNESKSVWDDEYKRSLPRIEECQNELSHNPDTNQKRKPTFVEVLRVNQLDAIRLDTEIYELLNSQFMRIFEFFKPETVERFKPELMAFLDLLIYRLSIYSIDTTYGNMLQNLKFANHDLKPLSQLQKVLYGILTIGGRWFWSRINNVSVTRDNRGSLRSSWLFNILNKVETYYKVFSVLNFLCFLYDGKYISPVSRLLSMRLVYKTISVKRQISFEYMNRQLVWHGFTEFLMFVMPLINVDKIKNWLARTFSSPTPGAAYPVSSCAICGRDPIQTPYVTNCNHIFCYYCLKQNLLIDNKYTCPRCGHMIKDISRYDGKPQPAS